MTERNRFETRIEDGVLAVDSQDGWLEIGPIDDVIDLVGGDTYTLEYTDRQAAAAWLDTDDDNTITIDVRDAIATFSFQTDVVTNLANAPIDETSDDGYQLRTELFADLLTRILDSKGALDDS